MEEEQCNVEEVFYFLRAGMVFRLLGREKAHEIGSKMAQNEEIARKMKRLIRKRTAVAVERKRFFPNLNNAETRMVGAGLVK